MEAVFFATTMLKNARVCVEIIDFFSPKFFYIAGKATHSRRALILT